jgi:hypothetical protein
MPTQTASLFNDKTKAQYYLEHGRKRWKDLFPSVQYYLEKNNLAGEKVLEIGCAAGGMFEIMTEKYGKVDYTGMDFGTVEIKHAKKQYPNAKFIRGDFLKNKFKAGQFDTVCAFLVVNHQPKYREFLREMLRVAKKRIIFDARIQYDYPTIVDLETNYLFYHGSGRRNYFTPFNFYELFNYLHLEDFKAKKISVYGYYTPKKSSAFLTVPKNKLIAGAFCVEKYSAKESVERWGGRPEFAKRDWCEYEIELPDFSMDQI